MYAIHHFCLCKENFINLTYCTLQKVIIKEADLLKTTTTGHPGCCKTCCRKKEQSRIYLERSFFSTLQYIWLYYIIIISYFFKNFSNTTFAHFDSVLSWTVMNQTVWVHDTVVFTNNRSQAKVSTVFLLLVVSHNYLQYGLSKYTSIHLARDGESILHWSITTQSGRRIYIPIVSYSTVSRYSMSVLSIGPVSVTVHQIAHPIRAWILPY